MKSVRDMVPMRSMVCHLIVKMVIAFVVAFYPVSVSGATNLDGFDWPHDQIQQVGDAIDENLDVQSDGLHSPNDPHCALTECPGHADQSGDRSMSGECCADFCVAAMALANTEGNDLDPHHQNHFVRPQRVLSDGVWAPPERPPGL